MKITSTRPRGKASRNEVEAGFSPSPLLGFGDPRDQAPWYPGETTRLTSGLRFGILPFNLVSLKCKLIAPQEKEHGKNISKLVTEERPLYMIWAETLCNR